MPDQILTFLKYIFLVVLYLFFLRVLRAVWIELREPKAVAVSPDAAPVPGMPVTVPADSISDDAADGGGKGKKRQKGAETLVVIAPEEQKGREYPLTGELTVGRASGCGVLLTDDTFVSQLHARVFIRDGKTYVEDLGSTNGTYLNKRKVTAAVPLRRGDRLQIGRTTMEVRR